MSSTDDVRVGCIGTTMLPTEPPKERIIVVYSRKTGPQNWRLAYSDDGNTWTSEVNFSTTPITQGLPYGRLLTLPDGRLLVTGYIALNGKFSLANWFSEDNGENWTRDEGADVFKYYSSSGHLFDEHSVIPVTNSHWLAVSRGRSSFVFYKTIDSGASWSTIGEMVDTIYKNVAHERLVAPMLDIIPGGSSGSPYVLLTYADRETSKSYYRIGRTDPVSYTHLDVYKRQPYPLPFQQ